MKVDEHEKSKSHDVDSEEIDLEMEMLLREQQQWLNDPGKKKKAAVKDALPASSTAPPSTFATRKPSLFRQRFMKNESFIESTIEKLESDGFPQVFKVVPPRSSEANIKKPSSAQSPGLPPSAAGLLPNSELLVYLDTDANFCFGDRKPGSARPAFDAHTVQEWLAFTRSRQINQRIAGFRVFASLFRKLENPKLLNMDKEQHVHRQNLNWTAVEAAVRKEVEQLVDVYLASIVGSIQSEQSDHSLNVPVSNHLKLVHEAALESLAAFLKLSFVEESVINYELLLQWLPAEPDYSSTFLPILLNRSDIPPHVRARLVKDQIKSMNVSSKEFSPATLQELLLLLDDGIISHENDREDGQLFENIWLYFSDLSRNRSEFDDTRTELLLFIRFVIILMVRNYWEDICWSGNNSQLGHIDIRNLFFNLNEYPFDSSQESTLYALLSRFIQLSQGYFPHPITQSIWEWIEKNQALLPVDFSHLLSLLSQK